MTKLSPKIKDFIATQMTDEDWKNILRTKLPKVSEDSINCDNINLYDCAYTVIRKLTEQKLVTCWSDMKEVLNPVNKGIIYKVENKLSVLCKGK